MRYVRKIGTPLERRGVECSQKFINKCWNEEDGCYAWLIYEGSELIPEMRKILVEEERVCCYCMRHLYIENEGRHKKNVTLEHIIPNHIEEDEWECLKGKYLQFDCLNADRVKVCYNGKLDDASAEITSLPHPHYVSFHNLAASCDGETFFVGRNGKAEHCCNNNRRDNFVLPIFFYEDIDERFGYDTEGKLDYGEEFDEKWFDKKNLNLSSDWLNSVRRFWYEFSQLDGYGEDSIETAITDTELRQEIMAEVDPSDTYFPGFSNNRLWTVLAEYRWFYSYYKEKNCNS